MKEPSAERKYTGLQSTVLVKAATCVAVAAPVYVTHIKKYKFILTILKKNRQAKVRAASECRIMRDERIAEWRRNRCWPKG